MSFIHDDFLLTTPAARRLFHECAVREPILDFHTHLPPRAIAENRQFENLFEMWLEEDHYKWRAMRAHGVEEKYLTGDARPQDKFLAWAKTVPFTLRNPLYHWTHLELKRFFDIDELLSAETAEGIWNKANERVAAGDFTTHSMLEQFDVRAVCTTDDPADELKYHEAIAGTDLHTRVFPTFRPDRALGVHDPVSYNQWLDKLSSTADMSIDSLDHLLAAIEKRHDAFHALGCRLSDHGFEQCFGAPCPESEAARIFDKARGGTACSPEEVRAFGSLLMVHFGRLDAAKGWTKQMHVGVIRNNSTRLYKELGPDTGLDSMSDAPQAIALRDYLDALDRDNALPKMIVYNLNPADNYLFATMLGNFNDGSVAGKMQLGSGWWYLDTIEGMQWQLNTVSNTGLLSHFVGMLTDSRSFMSFPRHEYFRRVLCDLVGRDVENGVLPDDEIVGEMIRRICYNNSREYLQLPVPED